jgi:DNA-binding transcriptional LysR family regulator
MCWSAAPTVTWPIVTAWPGRDLEGRRLCLLTPDMQNRRIINQNFMAAGVTPEAQVESNSTLVLASHVREGDWLTILPSDMAEMSGGRARFACAPDGGSDGAAHRGPDRAHREPHTPVLEALLSEAQKLAKTVKSVA